MPIAFGVLLLIVALALAGGALWLAVPLRRRVDQLSGDVNALQAALDQLRAEIAESGVAATLRWTRQGSDFSRADCRRSRGRRSGK